MKGLRLEAEREPRQHYGADGTFRPRMLRTDHHLLSVAAALGIILIMSGCSVAGRCALGDGSACAVVSNACSTGDPNCGSQLKTIGRYCGGGAHPEACDFIVKLCQQGNSNGCDAVNYASKWATSVSVVSALSAVNRSSPQPEIAVPRTRGCPQSLRQSIQRQVQANLAERGLSGAPAIERQQLNDAYAYYGCSGP